MFNEANLKGVVLFMIIKTLHALIVVFYTGVVKRMEWRKVKVLLDVFDS